MFKIYALKNCGFCQKTVDELRLRGLSFLYCPMDGPPDGPTITVTLEDIKKKYNWPTVPIIVRVTTDDEEFIGGYTDLVEYFDNEKPTV